MCQHKNTASNPHSMIPAERTILPNSTTRIIALMAAVCTCLVSVAFFLGSRLSQEGADIALLRSEPQQQAGRLGRTAGAPPHHKLMIPDNTSYDVCIVGAGLSGAVLAERYANLLGKRTLVVESREHIGGNCFDFVDEETGILMNLYGAHLFHTNNERVWTYLQRFQQRAPWVKWEHQVKGWIQGKLLPIPVNIDTVNPLFNLSLSSEDEMRRWLRTVQVPCAATPAAPTSRGSRPVTPPSTSALTGASAVEECSNAEEMALSRVGAQLYEWVFECYTEKQWGKSPRELDAAVTARIPVRTTRDPRYFADTHQVLPLHGYTHWFEVVLDSPLIDVVLGVDYFDHQQSLQHRCGKTFFTGPIDRYFAEAGLGHLEYRSIRFEKEVIRDIGAGFYQPNSVVNYPGPEVGFTRIVEYKHFLRQRSNHTVLVKEFSTDDGDPYYPVLNQRNRQLHREYQRLAEREEREKGVYFVGRLANYKYFDMDAAIANALSVFERVEDLDSLKDLDGVEAQTHVARHPTPPMQV